MTFLKPLVIGLSLLGATGTMASEPIAAPGNLQVISNHQDFELRWVGANTESDFRGYAVYAAPYSLQELQARHTPGWPHSADVRSGQPMKRCTANNGLFAAFGFLPSLHLDCHTPPLLEIDLAGAKLPCYNPDDRQSNLAGQHTSLDVSGATTANGWHRCLLKGLKANTDYTFMVTAIKKPRLGFPTMSWTSNLVAGRLRKVLWSGETTIPQQTYLALSFSHTDPTTLEVSDPQACHGPCESVLTELPAIPGRFYLTWQEPTNDRTPEIHLLADAAANVAIVGQGPLLDALTNRPTTSRPNEVAARELAGYQTGRFLVVENSSFAVRYSRQAGAKRFAKIIASDLRFDRTPDTTSQDAASAALNLLIYADSRP